MMHKNLLFLILFKWYLNILKVNLFDSLIMSLRKK
jgi:hypothetical protein